MRRAIVSETWSPEVDQDTPVSGRYARIAPNYSKDNRT